MILLFFQTRNPDGTSIPVGISHVSILLIASGGAHLTFSGIGRRVDILSDQQLFVQPIIANDHGDESKYASSIESTEEKEVIGQLDYVMEKNGECGTSKKGGNKG